MGRPTTWKVPFRNRGLAQVEALAVAAEALGDLLFAETEVFQRVAVSAVHGIRFSSSRRPGPR